MHQLVSSDSMMIVSVRLVYGERRREVSWHASTRHFFPATLQSVIRVNCGSRKQVLSGFRSSVDGHGIDVSLNFVFFCLGLKLVRYRLY